MSKDQKSAPGKLELLSGKMQRTAAHVAPQLIMLLHSHRLAAWQVRPGLGPEGVPIKGESCLSVRDARALASAHADLAERLRGDGVRIVHTLWVADIEGRQWCIAEQLATWQLPWEWLAQRFGLGEVSPWDSPDVLGGQLLPWLVAADDAAERQQLQRTREGEHVSETERLTAERVLLAEDNERLRAQNVALQQVDAEYLATYLPALFSRVFTELGAADLALLCGRVEPLAIPNPYPEPSEETLRTLQKRFRALPSELQRQIAGLVASLPQRQKLQPRPEMRELLDELEGR